MTTELRDKISELSTPRKLITPRIGNKIVHGAKETKIAALSYVPEATISQPDISKIVDLNKNVEAVSVVSSVPTEKRTTTLRGRGAVLKKTLQSRSRAVTNLNLKTQADQRLKLAKDEKFKSKPDASVVHPQNFSNHVEGVKNQLKDKPETTVAKEHYGEPKKKETVKDAIDVNNKNVDTGPVSAVGGNSVKLASVPETTKGSTYCVKDTVPPTEIQGQQSTLPRSKTTIIPITYHAPTLYPVTKLALRSKSKNSIVLKQHQVGRHKPHALTSKKLHATRKGEHVPNDEFIQIARNKPNVARVSDKTVEINVGEKSEDCQSTSTESLVITDSVGRPRCQNLSKILERRLSCSCRSDTDYTRETTSQIEQSWSESRNSPEIKSSVKKLPKLSKHRRYVSTTSDQTDLSDYASTRIKVRRKNVYNIRSTLQPAHRPAPVTKSNLPVSSPAKVRSRRRSNFSFFNALFDIVFWPFLFLRTDR